MAAGLAADALVLFHLVFILFVMGGGILVCYWRWLAWVHIPCAIWGALIELTGWICPLTPLENDLRIAAGGSGYSGGFIENYIIPVVYPAGLTHGLQLGLGFVVIIVNLWAYSLIWRRQRRSRIKKLSINT
jgi:hypothetical protein